MADLPQDDHEPTQEECDLACDVLAGVDEPQVVELPAGRSVRCRLPLHGGQEYEVMATVDCWLCIGDHEVEAVEGDFAKPSHTLVIYTPDAGASYVAVRPMRGEGKLYISPSK